MQKLLAKIANFTTKRGGKKSKFSLHVWLGKSICYFFFILHQMNDSIRSEFCNIKNGPSIHKKQQQLSWCSLLISAHKFEEYSTYNQLYYLTKLPFWKSFGIICQIIINWSLMYVQSIVFFNSKPREMSWTQKKSSYFHLIEIRQSTSMSMTKKMVYKQKIHTMHTHIEKFN